MSEDAFAGQEEEDSSVDDLTPSVTSNNSDVLHRPQGTAAPPPREWNLGALFHHCFAGIHM